MDESLKEKIFSEKSYLITKKGYGDEPGSSSKDTESSSKYSENKSFNIKSLTKDELKQAIKEVDKLLIESNNSTIDDLVDKLTELEKELELREIIEDTESSSKAESSSKSELSDKTKYYDDNNSDKDNDYREEKVDYKGKNKEI
jgi:hypothetical protein